MRIVKVKLLASHVASQTTAVWLENPKSVWLLYRHHILRNVTKFWINKNKVSVQKPEAGWTWIDTHSLEYLIGDKKIIPDKAAYGHTRYTRIYEREFFLEDS